MIKCNLAVLLAERNIKISELSKRTGISRTTLTALNQNQSKGIQFDTFDTLCTYLKISPNDLFIQETLEYDFTVMDITEQQTSPQIVADINIQAEIKYKNANFDDLIVCRVQLYDNGSSNFEIVSMTVNIIYSENIIEILKSIPVTFKTSLEEELVESIKAEIIVKYNLNEDIDVQVW
ncbi:MULTISPECIES: helix-turn-helix transcriptional regulator [unclassified Lysinibacillus]|uniref:helix-turn-helix domain-containing protein n=1 Tax=unclassified Lysinibacillus TaxID=2636778 RepID=UPI00201B3E06|nr:MULTISPECIES: helix-turn-helix transcriptional regulator [unclassified Lysinibacillus]